MREESQIMNDFTKEELQIILLEMNITINRHKDLLKIASSYQDLKYKLESMIDNYCGHEATPMGGECLHCDADLCYECGCKK